ncbi:MAG: DUF4214 domain-containing protein [Paracoccaceae bacterium]
MDETFLLTFSALTEGAVPGLLVEGQVQFPGALAPAGQVRPGITAYDVVDPDATLSVGETVIEDPRYRLLVANNAAEQSNGLSVSYDGFGIEVYSAANPVTPAFAATLITSDLDQITGPELPGALAREEFQGTLVNRVFVPEISREFLRAPLESFTVEATDGPVEPDIGQGLSVEEAEVVAYLYATALNRNGPFERGGLNFWIDAREAGLSEREMAAQFLDNPEFLARFGDIGTLTTVEIVDTFYLNALDRPRGPDEGQFWIDRLNEPGVSAADVLLAFATAPENIAGLGFVETLTEVSVGEWDFVG